MPGNNATKLTAILVKVSVDCRRRRMICRVVYTRSNTHELLETRDFEAITFLLDSCVTMYLLIVIPTTTSLLFYAHIYRHANIGVCYVFVTLSYYTHFCYFLLPVVYQCNRLYISYSSRVIFSRTACMCSKVGRPSRRQNACLVQLAFFNVSDTRSPIYLNRNNFSYVLYFCWRHLTD